MSADKILVIGNSGDGKSSALRNLPPNETFLINCISKGLPFRGWKTKYTVFDKSNPNGNLLNTANPSTILRTMEHINSSRPDIKYLVIDDFNYIPAYRSFDRASEKGFDKFVDIALEIKNIASKAETMRDDLTVIIMMHPDITINQITGEKMIKPKISGKMIENQLTFEGLFEKVLYCFPKSDIIENKITYGFYTNKTADTLSPAKTPFGMFEEIFIDNDLKLVIDKIKEFNEGE
jgi:hypothetical protein